MPYRSYAEFARTKGAKDKGKRKVRANIGAGGYAAIAGGLGAGVGAGALTNRYRQAELDPDYQQALRARDYASNPMNPNRGKVQGNEGAIRRTLKTKGGRNLLNKDLETLSNARKGLQSGIQGSAAGRGVEKGYASLKNKLSKSTSNSKYLGKTLGGNMVRGGGGLLAAAGGTAAVLNYLKNRKKKDSSLKGRATSALNRLRGR